MSPHKSIPTHKLKEILDHPHHQGIDGKDYGPIAHELQIEYWIRCNEITDKTLQQNDKNNREFFKHNATKHKRK